jgi:hypothetical protein
MQNNIMTSGPLHIEETTYRDMATVMFPKRSHTKLARSAVEFLVEQYHTKDEPVIDPTTLRHFVEFLISKKGYN